MACINKQPSTVILDDGIARLVVVPEAGAALARYDLRLSDSMVALFRPGPDLIDLDEPFELACNLLLPWSNRISGGGFRYDGKFHRLDANLPGEPCPIHGDAFQRAWVVESSSASRATLSLRVEEGPGPFRYDACVTYQLDAGALSTTLQIKNLASIRLPYGIGLHPWFPRTPDTLLTLPAEEIRLEDSEHLPAGRVKTRARPAWDFRSAAPLPTGWINNAFTRWSRTATISWPLHKLNAKTGDVPGGVVSDSQRVHLDIHADKSLQACIVYSPSETADFVCVEPVSHPVDSHNSLQSPLEGLRVLKPGESMKATCRFSPSVQE